jgi:hypothetical protein
MPILSVCMLCTQIKTQSNMSSPPIFTDDVLGDKSAAAKAPKRVLPTKVPFPPMSLTNGYAITIQLDTGVVNSKTLTKHFREMSLRLKPLQRPKDRPSLVRRFLQIKEDDGSAGDNDPSLRRFLGLKDGETWSDVYNPAAFAFRTDTLQPITLLVDASAGAGILIGYETPIRLGVTERLLAMNVSASSLYSLVCISMGVNMCATKPVMTITGTDAAANELCDSSTAFLTPIWSDVYKHTSKSEADKLERKATAPVKKRARKADVDSDAVEDMCSYIRAQGWDVDRIQLYNLKWAETLGHEFTCDVDEDAEAALTKLCATVSRCTQMTPAELAKLMAVFFA